MGIKETSLKLAAVSLIADEAKKAKDKLRAELQAEMESVGADRVKAEYEGETVAFVTTTHPKFKWEVTNERKFVNWVMDHMADEIVTSVRESSRDAILNKFQLVDSTVIDPNGEIVDWLKPNVVDPYLVTKFSGDGREVIRQAIIGNAIEASKVLELE